jgi:hypothetical protein
MTRRDNSLGDGKIIESYLDMTKNRDFAVRASMLSYASVKSLLKMVRRAGQSLRRDRNMIGEFPYIFPFYR